MNVNPANVCLFIPPELKKFKLNLFNRIGDKIKSLGGRTCLGNYDELRNLPDEIIPIVGASPELRPLIEGWQASGRTWIYWDRGYARRVFATWLPRGANGGYYRWHVNGFQMKRIRDVPGDRWASLLPGNPEDPRPMKVGEWKRAGHHIVIAKPSPTYEKSHGIEGWTDKTIATLSKLTDRRIVTRDKESKKSLQDELAGAHCLVSHGSNAAVEAVIMGYPVFVDPADSAAALVGQTDLNQIENPVFPDRQKWFHSLAYCQYNEQELVDGTLWRLIE